MSLVRSLVDGNLEGFRTEFESFLDRCPSFIDCVGIGRFLPVFFFSMFSAAHDANILNANERVYFRFDNHGIDTGGRSRNTGNLKVAVYRDGQKVIRCYSISDRPNSDGLRFSTREKNALMREVRLQNPNLREEDLNFEQYKVCMHGKGKSQGEKGAVVFEAIREEGSEGRVRFAKYSASEVNLLRHIELDRFMEIDELPPRGVSTIKEIERMQLDQDQFRQLDELVNFAQIAPGQQRIDNFAEMLRSGIVRTLRDNSAVIFRYITRTYYNNYRQVLEDNIEDRNQKFESHGFLLGFLANFSHRYTIGIDLDLSPGNSYVAFLVRHQAERGNVPIVVNLATGRTRSDTALNRARGDAKRLHASSFISIHTESRNTVCVGLNFNLNRIPFRVDTVELQQDRFPLVQRLFECVGNGEIIENIKDFLLQHIPTEIPINEENRDRILDCITGFTFGGSAFDMHHLELEEEDEAPIKKYIFRHGDEGLRCLTMVFHAEGSDIVILHIRAHDAQQQGAINLQTLNVNGNDVHVWEVSCTLNNQLELDIDPPNDLGLYHDYQNQNNGDLIQVPNAENVHNTLNQVMNNGWQNVAQHRELFRAISRVLMPMGGNAIIDVDSEDKFRSILHGVFYTCDNPDKVLTRYKIGQTYSLKRGQEEEGERVILTRITEQRLDLLLFRQPKEDDSDTHPIIYVLGFANNAEEVGQRLDEIRPQIEQFMKRERGYLPITPEDEIVFCPVVLNVAAQREEELITIPENLYIHKINLHYEPRGGGTPTAQGILERIDNVLRDHDRGTIQDVNDLITLDFATDNGYYRHWFQQHDISYAARARRYNFPVGDEMQFHIMGIENDQVDVLETHIRRFKREGDVGPRRSTLIVNLGGNHWVTLVIDYRNGNYIGYYADSLGHNVLNSVRRVLEDNNITLNNIIIDQQGNLLVQQRDGYNCGLWALENARDINEVLQQNNNLGNQGRGVLGEMRNSLTLNVLGLNNIVDENNLRNEEYFKDLRRDISRELQDVNTYAGRARYITTYANGHANLNEIMAFIINSQNQTVIRNLLLEYLKLTLSHVQSLHFDEEQQAALLQFVSSSFPNASIELVKQGLYLPSFEKRGVNVNGKCVAITRSLSQALSLHKKNHF